MNRQLLLLLLLVFSAWPSTAVAEDVLTLVYSANSVGEYSPCPT